MIDIHCHLLPNIDDGPKSWDESLEMVRIASGDGITGAVTTPHWIQGTNWQPSADTVRILVEEMNARIGELGMDFRVYPGMEIGIIADLARVVSSGEVLPLAEGDFVLIEIPFYSLPLGIEEVIFGLESMGKKTVLAHPERNREFQATPKRIIELVNLGPMVQVTAGSLCGNFGDSARRCAIEFANLGAVHFVSSDAHSVKHRSPVVSRGLAVLEKEIGAEKTTEIITNSYKVINGNRAADK
ncbi:MAG: CpsB/CapC family capsule biosynthesis tyrosine phosphatase [Deltaproteobacteria bacterium]